MPKMGLRAYSRHRGVTLASVQAAVKSGRITREADGTVDSAKADAEWQANTDHSKNPKGPRNADNVNSAAALQGARAVKESYAARLMKLQHDKLAGTLVDADEVRRGAFSAARKARDLLLSISARVSPVVAGLSDPMDCARVIDTEVNRVLDELSGTREAGR